VGQDNNRAITGSGFPVCPCSSDENRSMACIIFFLTGNDTKSMNSDISIGLAVQRIIRGNSGSSLRFPENLVVK
jgi:hypothetical protein